MEATIHNFLHNSIKLFSDAAPYGHKDLFVVQWIEVVWTFTIVVDVGVVVDGTTTLEDVDAVAIDAFVIDSLAYVIDGLVVANLADVVDGLVIACHAFVAFSIADVRDGLDFSVVTDGLVFASLSDVIYVFVIDNLADVKIGLVVASFTVVIVGLAQNGIVAFSLADVIDSFANVIDGLFAYNSATVA